MTETILLSFTILAVVILIPIVWGFFAGYAKDETEINEKMPSVLQLVFGALICVGGIAIGAYQVYLYLKEGVWEMISTIDVLVWLEMEWAFRPEDWFGVWKILDRIPAGLVLIIIGALVIRDYDSQIFEYKKTKAP